MPAFLAHEPAPPRARALTLLLVVAASSCSREAPAPPANAPRWNVVLYLVDTLRRDRMSLYGYHRDTTPNLRRLADECFVFEDCHAPAPWTLPSVVSMMTSTYPLDHHVLVPGAQVQGLTTLPEHMKRLGYRTGGFVTNPFGASASGLVHGYDVLEEAPEDRAHAVDLQRVRAFLEQPSEAPFFLYLHSTEPHRPFKAPARFVDQFRDVPRDHQRTIRELMRDYRALTRVDYDEQRTPGETDNRVEQSAKIEALATYRDDIDALYDGGVAWADDNVAALVQMLRERGEWENTLFVFVADHGEELLDHGGWLHHQHLYAELIRAPMLWHLPGTRPEGRPIDDAVTLLDVTPTILGLLGHAPETAAGRNLAPLFEGQSFPADDVLVVANRFNRMHYFAPYEERRGDLNVALVRGPWKAIWNVERDSLELYDRLADPTEQDDLAARREDVARFLHHAAQRWWNENPARADGTSGPMATLDPATLERLRELGYVR